MCVFKAILVYISYVGYFISFNIYLNKMVILLNLFLKSGSAHSPSIFFIIFSWKVLLFFRIRFRYYE